MKTRVTILLFLSFALVMGTACSKKEAVSTVSRQMQSRPSYDGPLPPDTVVLRHDTPPKMIEEAPIEYPKMAQTGGFEGKVTVKAFIDENGKAIKAKAVRCAPENMGFEQSAVEFAYNSTYQPASIKGTPVGVWIMFDVVFRLDKDSFRTAILTSNLYVK